MQKEKQFDKFLAKDKFCLVTLSKTTIYEPFIFEAKVKKVYDQIQEHPEVGYMVVIENVFDDIGLYQLAQTAYYLNRMTILQYKIGLN